jgi:hypothetical protein
MRWDLIQMRWPQYRILARRRWRMLSDSQLDSICGLRELLAQNLQVSYGLSRETAERDIESWTSTFDEDAYGPGEPVLGEVGKPPEHAQALRIALEQRRRSDPRR